jgi:hypothetical protein
VPKLDYVVCVDGIALAIVDSCHTPLGAIAMKFCRVFARHAT